MTDDNDIARLLQRHVGDEPPLGITARSVTAAGRRSARRRRALGVGGVVAAVTLVVGGSVVLQPGSTGWDGTPNPDPDNSVDPVDRAEAAEPALTPPDEMPGVIRGFAREYLGPDAEEERLEVSTWENYSSRGDYGDGPPQLDPADYAQATKFGGRCRVDGFHALDLGGTYEPPDLPEGMWTRTCSGRDRYGTCATRQLPDSRQVLGSTRTVGPAVLGDEAWAKKQYVVVWDGNLVTVAQESLYDVTDDGFDLDYLLVIASDPSLAFPEPDPLPPLPSWQLCTSGWTDDGKLRSPECRAGD